MLVDLGRGCAQPALEATMKMLVLAACVLTAGVGTVRAACNSEIEKTKNDWSSIRLEPASKPSAISKGVYPHEHVQAAVDSMRYHLAEAEALCKEGQDHESLLHLDVLRAFLMLPEIQHPASHHFLFKDEKREPRT
jgi:hypothetical protein